MSAETPLVRVRVNGGWREARAEPRMLLADFLRHELGLTGVHVGCEHGVCGACTIRVEGVVVRSCLLFAIQVNGQEIETVEGLSAEGELDPVQRAFHEHYGLQCGFCTPGFLFLAHELIATNPDPSDDEIRDALSANICRCTGYNSMVAAVGAAAKALRPDPDGAAS